MIRHLNVFGMILVIILFYSCEDKPVVPSLTTTMVTEISTTTAVSGGTITDDGGAQIITGGVCWNTSEDPTIENTITIVGGDLSYFTSSITQLSPNTTYYVRAYATNSAGTGYGKSKSFKTLGDKPVSNNLSASNITINSATFNSSVNANLLSTTVTFEYGVTSSYGSTVTVPQNPVTGNTNVNVSADLTGLTPGTTYHFRIKTENSLGITYSSDMTFITLGKVPDVTILAATNLQVRSATISGSVNPNFLSSTVTFEWGATTSYGNTITPTQSPINGSSAVGISTNLTGLTPGTTYHFKIIAINELGTSNSNDFTFTTLGLVPTATTQDATDIKLNTATINGSVNPNHLTSMVSFEWGTTSSFGNSITPTQSPVDGNTLVNLSANLSGLTPGTTYHYRIVATNELGTSNSENMTFTTYSVADIENNLYHSVTIGTQVWLAENLKTSKFNDGTSIPLVTDQNEWNTAAGYSYCWYNNSPTNKDSYGALYNWWAVDYTMNINKNICPLGWHVPAKAEWSTLFTFLIDNGYGNEGSGNDIAKSLAARTRWNTDSNPGSVGNNLAINNSSGFTALAGGIRTDGMEGFIQMGVQGAWWAVPDDYSQGYSYWCSNIFNFEAIVHQANTGRKAGLSIRCLKD
jgi:uncharacterized protein (TIGR02145 family)